MTILILLVIALAVVVWFKRAKKSLMSAAASSAREGAGRNPFARRQREEQAEAMVQCAYCGMHFPASEAVVNTVGATFCSEEHGRLASS